MVRPTTIAIATYGLMLVSGSVHAGPGPLGKEAGPMVKNPAMREAAMKRFDQNGDGKLDAQELAAARQALQARGLPGKGGPGMGGQGMGRPGKPNGGGEGPGREAVLQRFDKDGDGKLNEDERAAARKAFEERKNK